MASYQYALGQPVGTCETGGLPFVRVPQVHPHLLDHRQDCLVGGLEGKYDAVHPYKTVVYVGRRVGKLEKGDPIPARKVALF